MQMLKNIAAKLKVLVVENKKTVVVVAVLLGVVVVYSQRMNYEAPKVSCGLVDTDVEELVE